MSGKYNIKSLTSHEGKIKEYVAWNNKIAIIHSHVILSFIWSKAKQSKDGSGCYVFSLLSQLVVHYESMDLEDSIGWASSQNSW